MFDLAARGLQRTALVAPLCATAAAALFALGPAWRLIASLLIALAAALEAFQAVPDSESLLLRRAPLALLGGALVWLIVVAPASLVPATHLSRLLACFAASTAFWACSRAVSRRPTVSAIPIALGIGAAIVMLWPSAAPSPEAAIAAAQSRDFLLACWRLHPMEGLGLGCGEALARAALGPHAPAVVGWRGALAEGGLAAATFALALAILVGLKSLAPSPPAGQWWSRGAAICALAVALAAILGGTFAGPVFVLLGALAGAAWGASFSRQHTDRDTEEHDQGPQFYDFPLAHDNTSGRLTTSPRQTPPSSIHPIPSLPLHTFGTRLSAPWRIGALVAIAFGLVLLPAYILIGRGAAARLPLVPREESEIQRAATVAARFPWSDRAALAWANGLTHAADGQGYPDRLTQRANAAYATTARRNPLRVETWVAWTDLQRNVGRIHEMRDLATDGRAWCAASPRLALWHAWASLLLRDRPALEQAWEDAIELARQTGRPALAEALMLAIARYHEQAGNTDQALDAYCARLLTQPHDQAARAGVVRVAASRAQSPDNEKP